MGGRGSGGGRSGGGGGGSQLSKFTNKNIDEIDPNSRQFNEAWQKEYSKMSDEELNRAYTSSRRAMRKANKEYDAEQDKLSKVLDDFRNVKESDSDYKTKSDALSKQMGNVDKARDRASIRQTVHYLAVNEKYNVRGKKK